MVVFKKRRGFIIRDHLLFVTIRNNLFPFYFMERHWIKKLIKRLSASKVFKVVLNTSVKIKSVLCPGHHHLSLFSTAPSISVSKFTVPQKNYSWVASDPTLGISLGFVYFLFLSHSSTWMGFLFLQTLNLGISFSLFSLYLETQLQTINLHVDLKPYRDLPLIFATVNKLKISIGQCFIT